MDRWEFYLSGADLMLCSVRLVFFLFYVIYSGVACLFDEGIKLFKCVIGWSAK